MLRKVIFLSLSASVLSITLWPGRMAAAPPSNTVPANVDFVYRAGDRITDDRQGTYIDGMSGVSCDFHPGTGDLTFHPSSPGSGQNTRALNFLFGTPLMPCSTTPGGKVPASPQSASLTVSGIYGMTVGETTSARAFYFLTEAMLRFANTNYCANQVSVSHPDPRTWWVSATPTSLGVGDLAVLTETIKGQTAAAYYWEMPFQIRVTLQ